MARLDRLSRPKEHPSQDVSSIIGDCENCTFNPQVTRYAAQMDGPEFMERLPRYTAAYMQKKNHTAEVDFSFAPELNVVREDGSKPDRDEFFRKMEADIQKRRRKAEEVPSPLLLVTLSSSTLPSSLSFAPPSCGLTELAP